MPPNDELDDILKELDEKPDTSTLTNTDSETSVGVTDENVNDFLLDKMGTLVNQGLETINSIQKSVITGFEPDELNALSGLINSITKAADVVNKINLQNKKAKTAKELKVIDVSNKQNQITNGTGQTTNNILIATREEIMKQILEGTGSKDKKAKTEVEVEYIEEGDDN